MTVIKDFAQLFSGREDAFGLDAGGCVRNVNEDAFDRWIECHLTGEDEPLGVYPLVFDDADGDAWYCKWGAVDLDVKGASHATGYESAADAYTAARNLRAVLRSYGLTGWIEITRSGGFHVWLFAEEWVSASDMRRCLLVACEVAGVPPTEVNPKSEGFDDPTTLGNYVRLPYPGALAAGITDEDQQTRVAWDEDGYFLSVQTFLADALETLAVPNVIAEVAALYQEPAPETQIEWGKTAWEEIDVHPLMRRLTGLGATIARNEPLEGQDRSSRAYKLAIECHKSGLTPDEACAIQAHADRVLDDPKYINRPDAERRIRQTVARAYQKAEQ